MSHFIIIFLFWISVAGIAYAYFGYPFLLFVLSKIKGSKKNQDVGKDIFYPKVSIIIPFYNEEKHLPAKIENLLELKYPKEKLELIFVSDGSSDKSDEIVRKHQSDYLHLFRVEERKGKGAALDLGVEKSKNDIIVFTDASIMLEELAIVNILQGFKNPEIGCVSGEDYILENSGEGAYGKYELWLRNLESNFSSIVGASGSFYAQRKELVEQFIPGMAPDFLSVLNTVDQGYRAVTNQAAKGYMKSVKKASHEFSRKVRTLVRGMAALSHKKMLLNFFKYPSFAFCLFSHKVIRWLVPWMMILAVVLNILLVSTNDFYQFALYIQLGFYGIAGLTALKMISLHKTIPGKISLYFTLSNLAILVAWFKYWLGSYQEVWQPSARN